MKRLLVAIAFSIALLTCASAQMLTRGVGSGGTGGGGAASPTFTVGSAVVQNNAFSSGTKTISGVNGGTNFPANALVIVGLGQDQSGATITVTIGGQTASLVSGTQDSGKRCQIYQAVMPGTSQADIVTYTGAPINTIGVASAILTGVNTTVSSAGFRNFGAIGDPQTLASTITVPTNGFGFIFAFEENAAALPPTAITWTNTTSGSGDSFARLVISSGGVSAGAAHTATSGAGWNPGASGVTNNMSFKSCLAGAAYGP